MIIEIDMASETPIYTQLVYQIKLGIVRGRMHAGDSLPSVRSLAGDIGINLHTVNKAYKVLVGEGVLTQVKKGYEISRETPPKISETYKEEFKEKLFDLMIDANVFDIDVDMLLEEMKIKLKGDEQHD
ncbi:MULTISPECIES: GntR family transcriptional regulator [Vagococcus]|uniref:Transcriptional regulator, GntR family n=1 Tax=Vagococcus fluvialis bH819 TaxID=1255619 RepID=A0A1X6WL66_9ENTE|nr:MULTISPECIES: GntR family transcriptional regulator [Vagococcus]SLM85081.1 Transcriptional regulator, GntR family [Vagococcus fluvialis bH819]HCM88503.1 GntR family transcriptional regulator [Vagococcus sp.]